MLDIILRLWLNNTMDNSPEGHKKQQGQNLGEGIKPEDVIYSSQDILGNSLAGEGQKYFTRVKEKRPDLKTYLEQLKEQKKEKKPRTRITKKQKIILIIAILVLVLLVIATLVIFLLLSKNRTTLTPEQEAVQKVVSETEDIDTTTSDGLTEFNIKANEIMNMDSSDSTNAARNVYLDKISEYEKQGNTDAAFNLRIQYYIFIVEHGDPVYAETLVTKEIDVEMLNDEQKCKYYGFLYYLYLRLNNPTVANEYKVLMEDLRKKLLEEGIGDNDVE